MALGIVIGVVGIAIVIAAYPVHYWYLSPLS